MFEKAKKPVKDLFYWFGLKWILATAETIPGSHHEIPIRYHLGKHECSHGLSP